MGKALPATLLLWSCLVGTAAAQSPLTITDVSVTVGSGVFTSQSVEWLFPVTLNAGESLILAQNTQGQPNTSSSFNFDLSAYAAELAQTGTLPSLSIALNGVVWTCKDYAKALVAHGSDGGNKSGDFRLACIIGILQVWVGFADNVSEGICAAPRCFPEPFFNPTYFQSTPGYLAPGNGPDSASRAADHCIYGAPACWKTAAIYLVNTDTPSEPKQVEQ